MTVRQVIQEYLDKKDADLREMIAFMEKLGAPKVLIEAKQEQLSKFSGSQKYEKYLDMSVVRRSNIIYHLGRPNLAVKAIKIFVEDDEGTILLFILDTCTLTEYQEQYDITDK